jgi:two-component system sensor histidine kinase KdpD
VKYSKPESEISVEARSDAKLIQIAVSDRGQGIPVNALPHLFDPFYRAIDRSGGPRPGGLGLGLAVVKGLVEAHGGRVWAENRAGGGARFAFTLPQPESDSIASAPPAPEHSAA